MEMFSTADDDQWKIIKEAIDSSDFYILIIGNRYGSIEETTGISYTEKKFDYADVKITATGQIAAMYIRKQGIFTEKRIFKYVTLDDLRLDLLPRMRKMATNNMEGIHSWESMTIKVWEIK